jgi:hypothetical protein
MREEEDAAMAEDSLGTSLRTEACISWLRKCTRGGDEMSDGFLLKTLHVRIGAGCAVM